jgi:hypothetical protein
MIQSGRRTIAEYLKQQLAFTGVRVGLQFPAAHAN